MLGVRVDEHIGDPAWGIGGVVGGLEHRLRGLGLILVRQPRGLEHQFSKRIDRRLKVFDTGSLLGLPQGQPGTERIEVSHPVIALQVERLGQPAFDLVAVLKPDGSEKGAIAHLPREIASV